MLRDGSPRHEKSRCDGENHREDIHPHGLAADSSERSAFFRTDAFHARRNGEEYHRDDEHAKGIHEQVADPSYIWYDGGQKTPASHSEKKGEDDLKVERKFFHVFLFL